MSFSESVLVPKIIKNGILCFGIYVTYKAFQDILFDVSIVGENTMYPNLKMNQIVLSYKRYDMDTLKDKIVLYRDSEINEKQFRRISGLPGEWIEGLDSKSIIVVPNGTFHISKDVKENQTEFRGLYSDVIPQSLMIGVPKFIIWPLSDFGTFQDVKRETE